MIIGHMEGGRDGSTLWKNKRRVHRMIIGHMEGREGGCRSLSTCSVK